MTKLTTTLACAFAVLAFSAGAWAQDDDVLDEDHIDDPENGKYVFWDEEEMEAFIAEYGATVEAAYDEGGGMLDACFAGRPIAYVLSTLHEEGTRYVHWHVDTAISWNSTQTAYVVCSGAHMYSDVDGIKAQWKTTSSSACDYCDWDDWEAKYYNGGTYSMTYDQGCSYDAMSDDILYWGEERGAMNNWDYENEDDIALFDRTSTSTDSKIMMLDCIP